MNNALADPPEITLSELLDRLPESIQPTTPMYIEVGEYYCTVVGIKSKWIGDRRALVLIPEPVDDEEEEEEDEGTDGSN